MVPYMIAKMFYSFPTSEIRLTK